MPEFPSLSLRDKAKERADIDAEIVYLEKALKDPANDSPICQKMIKLRHNALVEQYDQNSVNTIKSSFLLTSGTASSVGVALTVFIPPLGAAVTLGGTAIVFGLLAVGAGKSAYQNRTVIKTSGDRVVNWNKNRKLESEYQAELKKMELLGQNLDHIKRRVKNLSSLAHTEMQSYSPKITELLEEIKNLEDQGIQVEPDESAEKLTGMFNIIKEKIQTNQSEVASLFQAISTGKGDPAKLREKLQDLSTTIYALQQNQNRIQNKLSLIPAKKS